MLIGVAPENLDNALLASREMLEASLKRSRYELTVDNIAAFVHNQDMQLWILLDDKGATVQGVIVTELKQYPQFLAVNIVCLAGEEDDNWEAAFQSLEAWAVSQKASYIEGLGRPGFAKWGKKYGMQEQYRFMSKPLFVRH